MNLPHAEFIDLHCHYVPAVDDGVRTSEEGRLLLAALKEAGIARAIATPHIRTAMFENKPIELRAAFASFVEALPSGATKPKTEMAAEHFFDDVFWMRFVAGDVCPYPGGRAILVEFPRRRFPLMIERLFAKMVESGIRPVLAHPERYQPVWADPRCVLPLIDAGAVLLLDSMSLVGEYGKQSQDAAEALMDLELYGAACSDSHRPAHVPIFSQALALIEKRYGEAMLRRLLTDGPTQILEGKIPSFVGGDHG